MEVESLERAESMVSTNEGLILNRLKAVEKSSEDIIKVSPFSPSVSVSLFLTSNSFFIHLCVLQEAQNSFAHGETGISALFLYCSDKK